MVPQSFLPKIELSLDERGQLQQLLTSEGWKVFADKVWRIYRERNIQQCRLTESDHRFWQGFDRGFEMVKQLLEHEAKPPQEMPKFHPLSELDLRPRGRSVREGV